MLAHAGRAIAWGVGGAQTGDPDVVTDSQRVLRQAFIAWGRSSGMKHCMGDSGSERRLVGFAGQSERVSAGSVIFQEGEPGDVMFGVRDGEVSLRVRGVEVDRVGPGDFFGELALIDHGPRSAAAIAGTDCELVRIDEREASYRTADGEQRAKADHVILATSVTPDTSWAESLRSQGFEVHTVGDAAEVGYIQGAIRTGYLAGRSV